MPDAANRTIMWKVFRSYATLVRSVDDPDNGCVVDYWFILWGNFRKRAREQLARKEKEVPLPFRASPSRVRPRNRPHIHKPARKPCNFRSSSE